MPTSTPAVILSGGLSERLGQAKALVKVRDQTILSIAVKKLQNVGCDIILNRNSLIKSISRVLTEFLDSKPEEPN